MKELKNNIVRMFVPGIVVALFTFSSCKDDENPVFADPTITVTPSTATQAPGGKITFSVAIVAEGGAAFVKVGDTEIKSYTTLTKADAFTFDYTVPAGATTGNLVFTITDKQATPRTGSTEIMLTIGKETVIVDATITSNTTWSANKYYLLKGNVYVQAGAELTIDPGTIIFGDKVTKGALIISRGAKIHAKGTVAAPIIFTSSAPKGFRNYGDWGGVVLLGKAVNNQSADQTIEGISAATGDNGKYGGTADDDNSGEFYYARIEFAGIALSTDNELNGLTLGSVGSATQVHHIQVSFSGDDSFEWFGGTINTQYLVAYRGWDDEFDTDFGFRGNSQFLASFRDPNIADKSGSNGFESDNDGSGSTKTPLTAAKFSNVTIFGPYVFANLSGGNLSTNNASANYQNGGHIRRNSALQIYNTAIVGWGRNNGVFFDKTNVAAIFKGNYLGRTVGSLKTTDVTNGYSDATFTTDNAAIEATQSTVDLSAKFAGMTGAMNIATPNGLLATGSPLLTGAVVVPTGLIQTQYIGAFDATTNWMAGWTNFDPINTQY
ncbi:MAG: hypothetical protein JNM78_14715 [Cyclobacteriaceae bacterium]|nr:hypothetical protein [Cyclobacteriaceae bacterium]